MCRLLLAQGSTRSQCCCHRASVTSMPILQFCDAAGDLAPGFFDLKGLPLYKPADASPEVTLSCSLSVSFSVQNGAERHQLKYYNHKVSLHSRTSRFLCSHVHAFVAPHLTPPTRVQAFVASHGVPDHVQVNMAPYLFFLGIG